MLDPLMPEIEKPTNLTNALDPVMGADVTHLMESMPEASRQYQEIGRDMAVQSAIARWPLLLEIKLGAVSS